MGFGSYDESEQEKRDVTAEVDDETGVATNSRGHDGAVDYEFDTSNDELLARLQEIKDESTRPE